MTSGSDSDDPVRLSSGQVAQLADMLEHDGVRTVYLNTRRGRFAVTRGDGHSAPAGIAGSGPRVGETVRAATVGEFLVAYPTKSGPLARPGARVAPGDILGLVRTGPIFTPVIVPPQDTRAATLTRVLATPGSLVGYSTPLFELDRL